MKSVLMACIVLFGSNVALGVITLHIPDQGFSWSPNQEVRIYVSGGDPIQGCNLHLKSTGAPFTGGSFTAPGCIFAENHSAPGAAVVSNGGAYLDHSITTASGTVIADGLLYVGYFDATAMNWQFVVATYQDFFGFQFPTDFAPTPAIQDSGTLSHIPEPGALLLLAPVLLMMSRRVNYR